MARLDHLLSPVNYQSTLVSASMRKRNPEAPELDPITRGLYLSLGCVVGNISGNTRDLVPD